MSNKKLASEAWEMTQAAEAAIRQAICIDMSRRFGPHWYPIIAEISRDRWKRLEQENKEIGVLDRHAELLDFATIDEISFIITSFAEAFETRFGIIDAFQVRLKEFRLLRNALAHGGELSDEKYSHLISLAEELSIQSQADTTIGSGQIVAQVQPQPFSPDARAVTVSVGIQAVLSPAQASLLRVVQQATSQMSGILVGERDALVGYLRANRQNSSADALSFLYDKFVQLPGTSELFGQLHEEIAPARPPSPKANRTLVSWLKWADRFYMPYRRWLIRYSESDIEVDEMALLYEDWLRQHYPELLRAGDKALVTSIYVFVKEQLNKGMRVLWLVIDNLCGLWEDDLVTALFDAGIYIRDTHRMLALLPTTTAISRRALLAGRLPSEAIKFPDDQSACRQLWLDQGVTPIAFCTSFQEAEKAAGEDAKLIILIDNWLDTLAHQPEQPGFDREEQMQLKMRSLTNKVGALVRQMNIVTPTRLVIGTDHGATYPAVNSQVVALPPSAISDDDVDGHHRFSIIRDPSGLNSVDWHVLPAELYGLPWTCAIARGQRFIGKRLKAYTHGGLSPEETVVKLLIADFGEREQLELALSQATPELRLGRSGQLAILVRNPFDLPIEDLELSLPSLQIQFPALDVPPRSEASTAAQYVTLPLDSQVHDGATHLLVTMRYQVAGRLSLLPKRLRVRVKELYRSAMDDFGDMLND